MLLSRWPLPRLQLHFQKPFAKLFHGLRVAKGAVCARGLEVIRSHRGSREEADHNLLELTGFAKLDTPYGLVQLWVNYGQGVKWSPSNFLIWPAEFEDIILIVKVRKIAALQPFFQ